VRRVVYVLKVFPKLSETFIARELVELRRRGIELRILSLRRPAESLRHESIGEAGLDDLVCYKPEEFDAILEAFRPDLLHAHFALEATETAQALATKHGLSFTFTAHGYDVYATPPPNFLERAESAAALITVSEANARYIAETFAVSPAHIHVIASGVDVARFCPSHAHAVARSRRIVCVARHVRVKRLDVLLRACALLRDRGVEFQCVMVGGGVLEPALRAMRDELGLAAVVEMTGDVTEREVLSWWRQAGVGVLTSDNEGMPVSLMEAAACGVPVVATAVGGVPELVEEGVTGFLTQPEDAPAVADRLGQLLENPSLGLAMGTAARQRAEERFSVGRQVDRLLSLWGAIQRV